MARRQGLTAAQNGLRYMELRGELLPVCAGVWVHAAKGRLPGFDQRLEAQARWLALSPRLLLQERAERTGQDEIGPVIGGGAAYRHWGFGTLPWQPAPYVPGAQDRVGTDDEVEVIVESIDPVDIRWDNQFPYLSPEATLARAYFETGDLDEVASALSEAKWRLYPLRPELLAIHIAAAAESEGWTAERWNARLIYEHLVERAGGWPTQPGDEYGGGWWPSAAQADRVRRLRPSWLVDGMHVD